MQIIKCKASGAVINVTVDIIAWKFAAYYTHHKCIGIQNRCTDAQESSKPDKGVL